MIEDTSSAAWYQQSILTFDTEILWTVKECIDNFEYHLIRRMQLHPDFFQSLQNNKGLPPASLKEVEALQESAVAEFLTGHGQAPPKKAPEPKALKRGVTKTPPPTNKER